MNGVVIKSTGSWYLVRTKDNTIYKCRIRGKFRMQGIKSTNPVSVGDHVDFDLENQKDLENSIENYQNLLKINNVIQKKFQVDIKNISEKAKEKISKISSKKNAK